MQIGRDPNTGYMASPPKQAAESQLIGYLTRLYKTLPAMKIIDPEDDDEMRSRISHALKRNEKIMEFVARTGLGRAQILTMNGAEISAFVAQAELNAKEDPCSAERWEPAR